MMENNEDEDEKELPRKRQCSVWTKDWVIRRQQEGFYAKFRRRVEK